MTFRVGQKVVCVDDGDSGLRLGCWDGLLKKGKEYTVSAIGLVHAWDLKKFPCILVAEIFRSVNDPFWAHRFRPVIERKTDISALTALLNPANHKELQGVE
jgi:hypothetical protein